MVDTIQKLFIKGKAETTSMCLHCNGLFDLKDKAESVIGKADEIDTSKVAQFIEKHKKKLNSALKALYDTYAPKTKDILDKYAIND